MSNQEKIAETDNGQLDLVSDELLLTGKERPNGGTDAVKVRLRSANPGAVGVYGWDWVFKDGSGAELGYIKMEIDDRYRDPASPHYPTGMIEVLLRKFVPGGQDDAEYVKVLRLRHDMIEMLQPVRFTAGVETEVIEVGGVIDDPTA